MSEPDQDRPYSVIISDNFHFMDEDEPPRIYGRFKTVQEAVEVCEHYVKSDMEDVYKPGMTPGELYQQYAMFGEDPYVFGPDLEDVPFSGRAYALKCAQALCGESVADT